MSTTPVSPSDRPSVPSPRVTLLAGGVGAARFLRGLVQVVDPAAITVITNTADDVVLHGLSVSPDLDTITYTLAGAISQERGWGLEGETWTAIDALARYEAVTPPDSTAAATWFRLGDQDLATHLYRSHRLREGASLSTVTREIVRAWGLGITMLPMSDDRVETRVTADLDGGLVELGFQEYFVRHRHGVPIVGVHFAGASVARPAPGVLDAIASADVVVIAPSNPIVSVGPILAVPGVRDAIVARRSATVAVSPIIAGAALKGPADRMLAELGFESSVVGVARVYRELAGVLVVDEADRASLAAVGAEGVRGVATPTVMSTPEISAALARTVLGTVLDTVQDGQSEGSRA